MSLLARASLRTYRRHPLQTALSVLGVALGVAVVLAIDLTTVSADRAFALAAESVGGRATHEIVGGSAGIDERLYATLRTELAVRGCAPVVEGEVRLVEGEDEGEGEGEGQEGPGDELGAPLSLLGIDPLVEAPLRPYFAFGSEQTGAEFDLARFLAEPGACAVTQRTAAARGWRVGEVVPVDATGVRTTLTIVSLLAPSDPLVVRGLDQVLIADVATAQEVLRRVGRLDRIDLVLADPADVARVRAALPDGVTLEDAGANRAALGELTRAFRLNLQALSLLTLMVGAFLIFNTVSFTVVRRRRTLGVLRALGADRGRIFRAVVAEGLVLGGSGALLGVGLGIGLAVLLLDLVTRTIRDHYFTTAVTTLTIVPFDLVLVVVVALLVSAAAALAPALDATRTAPREVILHTPLETRWRSRSLRGLGVALGLVVLGAAMLASKGDGLVTAYGGLFTVLLGAACATPAACRAVAWAARPLCAALAGGPGRYAARGVGTTLSRTAIATAALMLAVATTVGLGSMITSFRDSVGRWLESALRADVYVSAPAGVSERFRVRLAPELAAAVPRVDGVAGITTYRRFETEGRVGADRGADERGAAEHSTGGRGKNDRGRSGARWRELGAVRCVAIDGLERIAPSFEPVTGDPEAIHGELLDGGVMVSEPFGNRHGVARGDTLELLGTDGWVGFAIAGVFYDYGSEVGYVVMPQRAWARAFEDDGVSAFGLFAADGVDPDDLVERVRRAVAGGEQRLTVQSNRGLLSSSLAVFDRTFAVTGALRLLCVLVAFLGVWSALTSLQLERRREVGVLRALGATPRQVTALIVTQTALLGVGAGAWALPVGGALGWILVHVINRRSFGWTLLEFGVPAAVAIEALVLATVAAVLAGLQPAVEFGRIEVASALRED